MTSAYRILFAVYDGMTHLDFTGPHQFFSHMPESEVTVASLAGGNIASDGLTFGDTRRLAEVESCDLLCIPGGPAAMKVALDEAFLREIRRLAASASYVTAVCTGSLILGAAGLLRGRRAACHWASRHLLSHYGAHPEAARVVQDGNIVTGGGVTAGMDFALTMIAEIRGEQAARAVQLALEYAPEPPFDSGRPEQAPKQLVESFKRRMAPILATREAEVRKAAARLG